MNITATKYFNLESFRSNSTKLFDGDLRLNAEYYIHSNSFELPSHVSKIKLSKIARVVWFGPFKRYYIDNIKFGVPLVSSSEMMELDPPFEGIISKELTRNYEKYLVDKNTILVSCSGTIGNITLVDNRLEQKAISQDALRVITNDPELTGFIYTFFKSEYGQSVITGKKSGAVIDHIYEEDLNEIEIPVIGNTEIKKLNELVLKAFLKRDEANELLVKSEKSILRVNNLPPLSSAIIKSLDPKNEAQIHVTNLSEFTQEYRLDAHFYNPMGKVAITNIQENSVKYLTLKKVANDIIIGKRFKRNYVESEHGTPFIGSKNILQIRPSNLKYLSNSEIGFMDDLILHKNMILIACSGSLGGTFGKTGFVYNNFECYAASQHILRIVANENIIDPGYLYAFLSSEYGYECITRYRWGALIDEIDDEDMSKLIIPVPSDHEQKEIGDLVRQAYDLRAEAIRLEDDAQKLLTQALIEGVKVS